MRPRAGATPAHRGCSGPMRMLFLRATKKGG